MQTPNYPVPSVRQLFLSWLALTGWIFAAAAGQVRSWAQRKALKAKDALIDLGSGPTDRTTSAGVGSLPPLDANALALALRGPVEKVARQAAEIINEDPYGCWAEATEDQVLLLFQELGQEALDTALELRVATAEDSLPRRECPHERWAKVYRRILASAGRWPQPKNRLPEKPGSKDI